jgi:putative methionine-R-sulfoxide reductase with GAF domain
VDAEAKNGSDDALLEERRTVARQEEEIERLKRRLADEHFAEDLRQALTQAAVAGTIASPVTHARLLEMIVETAASVIGARAAALFLVDYESQQLTFEVALGEKAAEVKRFTVPMGHGIAGLVAVSGQPMAISDASSDPRQAADIARSVGYAPGSILCVPLFYGEGVIGVLELLDKEGAPSFSPTDMALLGLFANQAAVAIEQSRTHRNLAALIGEVLGSLDGGGGPSTTEIEDMRGGLRVFAQGMEDSPAYRQAVELARLVQEIAWQGEAELKLCHSILTSFADYLRSRPTLDIDSGVF